MADEIDDIARRAIAQRVAAARTPRPYEAIDRGAAEARSRPWRLFSMSSERSQRGALVAAIAAVAVVVGAGLVAIGAFGGGGDPVGVAANGDADAADTTEPATTTTTTIEAVETTNGPDDVVAVAPGPPVYEIFCVDGSMSPITWQGTTNEVNDLASAGEVCAAEGGVEAVVYWACPDNPVQLRVDAVDGVLPDADGPCLDLPPGATVTSTETATPTSQPGDDENVGLYTIDYGCESGVGGSTEILVPFGSVETESVVITIPAANDVVQAVNAANVCAGSGALLAIRFDTPCGTEVRTVGITAIDGVVPDPDSLDFCE